MIYKILPITMQLGTAHAKLNQCVERKRIDDSVNRWYKSWEDKRKEKNKS